MKIAILTQYYPPEMGAPQVRLSDLAGRLADAGHQVYVMTAMPSYPTGRIFPGYRRVFQHEKMGKVLVYRAILYPTKSVNTMKRLMSYFSFVFTSFFFGLFSLPRLDFLIIESPPLFLGLSGYLLSRWKGAKWIFNVSDLWPSSAVELGVVREGWALKAARKLESFFYFRAFLVTGQSMDIIKNIQQRFPGVKTYHLSNGVDPDLFTQESHPVDLRNRVGSEDSVIALYAGLHGIAQGIDQLLDAAEMLMDLPNFKLVLMGDGPEKEKLVMAAADRDLRNVTFLPPVPHEKMPDYLSATDIAVVTLKRQLTGAVPSKLYEAMGAGLPIVLVAGGEAKTILTSVGAGICVAPGDIRGIAGALRTLAMDKSLRIQMGTRARKAAESKYSRPVIAEQFIKYLESQEV